MKIGAPSFRRRSILLAAAGILALVLTACTGRGGGQLPPDNVFVHRPGVVRLQLQLRGQGRHQSANRSAPHPARLHRPRHQPLGSGFGIHGIVDRIDPVLESAVCIGQEPPPGGNELIFLGRYRLTSSAPAGFPQACPTRETKTTPLCRFEVIVRDNDQNLAPSKGDFFSIKLSTVTEIFTNDCPPGGTPPCVITEFPAATVFYARAGTLSSGNLTVR